MRRTVLTLCGVLVVIGASLVASVLYHLSVYLQRDAAVVVSRNESSAFCEAVIAFLVADNCHHRYLLTHLPSDRVVAEADLRLAREEVARFSERRPAAPLDMPAASLIAGVNRMLDLVEESIQAAAEGDPSRALEIIQSRPATALTVSIRAQAETLGELLDQRLQTRISTCRASMANMTRWVLTGTAALAATTTALILFLVYHNRQLRRLTGELTAACARAEQSSRDREEFLGMLSHELRTPLTPALITTEMLERAQPAESEDRKDLSLVRQQLQVEACLIDDLLDVSRVLRGGLSLQRTAQKLHHVIHGAASQLAGEIESRRQVLEVRLHARVDCVQGDAGKLQKVFWHLLSNASKFAPESGRIVVSSHNNDGRIFVLVQDNGIGFTREQCDAIFQPFKQVDGSLKRPFGGLGLGLSLARPIVELHGGTISAHSPGPNQGATFTVDLPVYRQE